MTPATNDTGVVPVDTEVPVAGTESKGTADEELKGNRLEPPNVVSGVPPGRQETPRPPPPCNDNGQAHSRGGVGVCLRV